MHIFYLYLSINICTDTTLYKIWKYALVENMFRQSERHSFSKWTKFCTNSGISLSNMKRRPKTLFNKENPVMKFLTAGWYGSYLQFEFQDMDAWVIVRASILKVCWSVTVHLSFQLLEIILETVWSDGRLALFCKLDLACQTENLNEGKNDHNSNDHLRPNEQETVMEGCQQ